MTAAAMQSAFERAGLSRADMIFYSACAAFLKSGGTPERGAELMARAAASDAPRRLGSDTLAVAAGSSKPGGGGRVLCETQSAPVAPVREPSQQQRAASAAVARTISITVMESYRVRDGRPIGDVRYGELARLKAANACEAAVVDQIMQHGKCEDHSMRVRDFVKVADLQRFIQRAAEMTDAQ